MGPEALWEVLSKPDRFREWWPWLRTVESEGFVPGTRSRCVVQAPLLYRLRFDVDIVHVVPRRRVDARVSGDLEGSARLELADHPEGCEARVWWEVVLRNRRLGAASRVARPVMEWGHDWVIDTGVRQFRRRALDEAPRRRVVVDMGGRGDGLRRKRRRVRWLQRYVLNPPVKVVVWAGLASGYGLLETTGRRTGKRRRNVVGMHVEGDTGWVIAEQGRHAGYVQNLHADPQVRVRIGRRWRPARAYLVADDDVQARLDAFGRRAHAASIRRFGTDLATVRVDFVPSGGLAR